ncbi:nuclear intron maturase 1, mitochondrial [Cucurbita maxima]|uniref:Nuclear intron maturase 1, mitochondrial n=1 Tax=Cucurbita maxima TaxID=3661 RepID=A0A6J1KII4_CUCMA|nr:nuclear intron maturase 1, mitochondrial [Cucurbita maxima]XP_023001401.1 nuclear intron maturase 1, mitochondrial [Cucurbita maxima]XP_023001402.1 nuclear intron maturase 1, mitochondrial [Cucurbita maxima]
MSFRTIIKHLQCNRRSFIDSISLARFNSSAPAVHPSRRPSISLQFQNVPQLQDQDPYSYLKEDPIEICSSIWVKAFASLPNSSFSDLSGFLSKFDLWVLAYQRSCADVTGSFPPRNAIHSHVLQDLLSLRNAVINGKFSWNRKANPLIRSPNDKSRTHLISKRKLQAMLESDEPCFQDRIVQEVLLNVIEPIFEARFSSKSHAFRPGRNAHSFIRSIRSNFAGYLWFLKADLSEIFRHVDENVVMGSLEKAIKDKTILRLVKSALQSPKQKRPRVEDYDVKKKRKGATKKKKILNVNEPKPDPYWLRTFFNFAPEEAAKVPSYGHCGILSPLLANVCLNELDIVMEDKISEYFRPSKLDSIWRDSINDGCHNPAWPEFVPASGKEKTRKMDYIRYGGHFLVGIRGPREDAVRIRKEIIEFCESIFGIRLDNSKIEIEHISRGILFLDHVICRRIIHPTLRYTSSGGSIVSQKCVGTLLSVTASLEQCIRKFRRVELVKGDRDPEPLPCNPMLYSSQAHTNSQMNKFLETMADWYRYADNRKKIVGFCAYVIRSSLAKLYAARYRLKSRAKVYGIALRNLSRPLIESSNNSSPEYSDLLRMGLVDAIEGVQFSRMSMIPSCDYTPLPRNWVPHHENVLREYIKLQDQELFSELHKVVKRKGLSLPQDEISEIVWGYKTLGACHFKANVGSEMEGG